MSVKVKFKSEMINSESSRKETSRTYYSFDYKELEEFIQTNYPEGSDSAIGEIIRTRFSIAEGAMLERSSITASSVMRCSITP